MRKCKEKRNFKFCGNLVTKNQEKNIYWDAKVRIRKCRDLGNEMHKKQKILVYVNAFNFQIIDLLEIKRSKDVKNLCRK